MRSLSSWLLHAFICMSPSFVLSPSILSGMKRCSRLILLFLSSSPGNNHFSKETCLLLVEMIFRNQDLYTRCAYCYRDVVVLRTSQLTELWNTYLYISFSLLKVMSSHWCMVPVHTDSNANWVNSSLISFPICNFFHWQKNLALLPSIYFLICSVPP